MKTFIDYYHNSVPGEWNNYESKPISACGDRATIQVDGRLNSDNIHWIAMTEGIKRGFVGYRLLKGESLLRAKRNSSYFSINQ